MNCKLHNYQLIKILKLTGKTTVKANPVNVLSSNVKDTSHKTIRVQKDEKVNRFRFEDTCFQMNSVRKPQKETITERR